MMTLSKYYQEPLCLEPLDSDPDKNGVQSYHRIVVCKPISAINNKPIRNTREVKVRPFPQSGLDKLREWFIDQTWEDIYKAESAHDKAEMFQKILVDKIDEIFPVKTRRINNENQKNGKDLTKYLRKKQSQQSQSFIRKQLLTLESRNLDSGIPV